VNLIKVYDGLKPLYDLRNDPRELNNVYGKEPYRTVQLELESRLLDWYIRTSDSVPFHEDPRGF
jgi:hypothetical protein